MCHALFHDRGQATSPPSGDCAGGTPLPPHGLSRATRPVGLVLRALPGVPTPCPEAGLRGARSLRSLPPLAFTSCLSTTPAPAEAGSGASRLAFGHPYGAATRVGNRLPALAQGLGSRLSPGPLLPSGRNPVADPLCGREAGFAPTWLTADLDASVLARRRCPGGSPSRLAACTGASPPAARLPDACRFAPACVRARSAGSPTAVPAARGSAPAVAGFAYVSGSPASPPRRADGAIFASLNLSPRHPPRAPPTRPARISVNYV